MGDAGILLNKMLAAINLDRKDIYITNVVNYRPPSNRKPEIKEIKRYSEYLYEHVEIINPKMIILLGSTAMEAFFYSYGSFFWIKFKNIKRKRYLERNTNQK